jgi:hypothetical protein
MQQIEDPSIQQQKNAVIKNHIKTCTISKWEHSPNDEKLKQKNELTVIYYNKFGLVDSLISKDFRTHRIVNKYDSDGKLLQRNEYKEDDGFVRLRGKNERPDYYESVYQYDNQNRLISEVIFCQKDSLTITVQYTWANFDLKSIEVKNDVKKSFTKYTIEYKKGKISKLHRTTVSDEAGLPDRTNDFIYSAQNLIEVTNTWMFADGKMSNTDITSTKFKYDKNDHIVHLQKVYGMWPGESFWQTTFRYLPNDLIEEKEMNNQTEFGKHKIIYKYKYE